MTGSSEAAPSLQSTPRRSRGNAKRGPLVTAGLLALVGSFVSAGAQDAVDLTKLKNMSFEEILQVNIPTVFGASKHKQKISEAPSSVTIVTREEIQTYGHRTFADILRSVRDFYVSYDRNYAYIGVRGFNRPGDFGGRTLILVDGLRMNDPAYQSAGVVTDFPIDVDLIERVEVIRGPGSSLYGNNAFFAVINVITRKAEDVKGGEASAEIGSNDTYKGRLTYGKTFDNGLSVLLTGTLYDSAGNERLYFKEFDQPVNNQGIAFGRDDDSFQSAGLTIGYKDFTLQAGYISRRKDVPTASYTTIFNDPQFITLDQRSFVRLGYAHDFDNELSVRANLHWNSYYYKGDYPFAADESKPHRATINRDVVNAQWWGGDFQVSKTLFGAHRLTLGLEYQNNAKQRLFNYDVSPRAENARIDTTSTTFGAFIQDEWAITKRLTLNAGLRYDWLDSYGGTVNPRAALIWHPVDKTTLKLLYGQAYRAPNTYEALYSGSGFRTNPELEPERIKSYELVLEQELTAALRLSASGFYNRIEGLITERVDSKTADLFFENTNLVETKGASIEIEAKLPKGIKGRASYTLQNTEDAATGERLSNSPEHLAKLNLMVPLYRDKIFSGLELLYTSKTENSFHQSTGGHLLTNWTLFSRQLVKDLEISAGVYNLFDKKYGYPGGAEHLQQSISQDGRTFRLKFTYRF